MEYPGLILVTRYASCSSAKENRNTTKSHFQKVIVQNEEPKIIYGERS
jgi:hypothetical protein